MLDDEGGGRVYACVLLRKGAALALRQVVHQQAPHQPPIPTAGAPYFERHYPSDVMGIYRQLTSCPDHITLVAVHATRLVGFGIAVPLRYKKAVARSLTGLVPDYHSMYLAELGVLSGYRGQGLGRALVRERLKLIDPDRYSHVVLRVPASRWAGHGPTPSGSALASPCRAPWSS